MIRATTVMMPAGRNRRDNGVSTEAAAAGTSLSSRNRLSSHTSVPVLSKTAETPNSAAPRPARSPAVRALGTRAGRFGHHHDSSDITEPAPDRACSGRPRGLTADAVRKPAATIGLKLAFDIARPGLPRRVPPAGQAGAQASWTYEL